MPGAISSSRALPALLHHRFLLRGAAAVGGLTFHRLTSATPEDSRNRTVTNAFGRERDFFSRRPVPRIPHENTSRATIDFIHGKRGGRRGGEGGGGDVRGRCRSATAHLQVPIVHTLHVQMHALR